MEGGVPVKTASHADNIIARLDSGNCPDSDDELDPEIPRHVSVAKKRQISWAQAVFGIGPTRRGVEGSRIIHPNSPFAQCVSVASTALLVYVAIVTPVTIGFFWTAEGCVELPTLKMDMVVDCFFLAEIVYNFFVGISYQGRYRDDYPFVAQAYLRGSFPFDLLTSVPVAIIEYVSLQACLGGAEPSVDAAQLRLVRATKPFRIFKMVRILRTSRLLYVFDYLESELRPNPFITRGLRIFSIIAIIVHLCVCCFWLIKDAYEEEGSVDLFLDEHGLSTHADLVDKYVLGMYFVNTVFTTVGFGDIAATNGAERVYYVSVMYVGTLVFGTMLGEVQLMMAQMHKAERERSQRVQDAKDYLRAGQASPHLERRLLRWIAFRHDCERRREQRAAMHGSFPAPLRRELAQHEHRGLLELIPVFSEMQHPEKGGFLLELFLRMETSTFCSQQAVALSGAQADRLHILRSGSIKVVLGPHGMDAPSIATLIEGDFLGENSLFDDEGWQTSQGKPASYWSETHVECLTLTRADFLGVLAGYPEDLEDEVFFLAEQAQAMRAKTALIDDIQLLRWCQLLYKILIRTRKEDRHLHQARARRTTFKLALHRQRKGLAQARGGGGERVRKSSLLLASAHSLEGSPLAADRPSPALQHSPVATTRPAPSLRDRPPGTPPAQPEALGNQRAANASLRSPADGESSVSCAASMAPRKVDIEECEPPPMTLYTPSQAEGDAQKLQLGPTQDQHGPPGPGPGAGGSADLVCQRLDGLERLIRDMQVGIEGRLCELEKRVEGCTRSAGHEPQGVDDSHWHSSGRLKLGAGWGRSGVLRVQHELADGALDGGASRETSAAASGRSRVGSGPDSETPARSAVDVVMSFAGNSHSSGFAHEQLHRSSVDLPAAQASRQAL